MTQMPIIYYNILFMFRWFITLLFIEIGINMMLLLHEGSYLDVIDMVTYTSGVFSCG